VPTLFWLEVVNVLAFRYRYAPAAIVEAVYELEQVGVITAEVGRPGVLAVIDAIGRRGITAYDAACLVLAESTDAMLLTADARLAVAARDRAILVGSRGRIGDLRTSYVTATSSWTDWRGAASYLSELRTALTEESRVVLRSVRGLDARNHRKVLHVPRDETGVD
jgi:predicted nucleic acid-binding protein